jgi:HSP90 family molecular chaperone
MKLGCIEDSGNHKRLAPLLRFYSSKSDDEIISLDQYVEDMPENQKAIYYLASDSLKSAKSAPFVEKLIQKDIEVSIFEISVAFDMFVKMFSEKIIVSFFEIWVLYDPR